MSFCAATVRARLHQHLEPPTETIGVEFFVSALPANAPQVEIQYARDLFGCGERDNVRAVLEPAGLNHAVKDFGLKVRDDSRQVRRIQQAIEQRPRLRHGTADNTGPFASGTVLNGHVR